jgi:hypothetical protein
MNTPISYSIAKLLKEKGFNKYCMLKYFLKKPSGYGINWKPNEAYNISGYDGVLLDRKYIDQDVFIYAPTPADVVMWLYEKHSIWIEVLRWTNQPVDDEIWEECFQAFTNGDAMDVAIFKAPTEAYEAAIEYVLTKLI